MAATGTPCFPKNHRREFFTRLPTDMTRSFNLSTVSAVLLGIASLIVLSIYYSDAILNRERSAIVLFSIASITFVGALAFLAAQFRRHRRSTGLGDLPTSSLSGKIPEASPRIDLKIDGSAILWIEKELLRLNKEIHGEERPPPNPDFLQRLPKSFLDKDILSPIDVEEFASYLVQETRKRIGVMEIPFRKPKV